MAQQKKLKTQVPGVITNLFHWFIWGHYFLLSSVLGQQKNNAPVRQWHSQKWVLGGILLLGIPTSAVLAGTVSPVQSTDRPYDLDIVSPVQLAGSDEQAADFQINDLPLIEQVVSESLSETNSISDVSNITLGYYTGDPESITDGINNTDAQLIFPDASSSTSYLGDTTNAIRTESEPLLARRAVEIRPSSNDYRDTLDVVLAAKKPLALNPSDELKNSL